MFKIELYCEVMARRLLGGSGEANLLVAVVKDGVVRADEDITEDPDGLGEIDAHETGDALSLGASGNLEHVLLCSESEALAVEDEVNIGHGGELGAVNGGLASCTSLGANFVVDGLDSILGAGNERSASVCDCIAVRAHADILAANLEGVHLEGPVSLRNKGDVCDIAFVAGLIDATKGDLTTKLGIGVFGEPEGENGVGNLTLGEHVVPHGGDVVHGDGIEGKAQDTVKLSGDECNARFLGDLSEGLASHGDVADLNSILGEETRA